ncbi:MULTISPECIES: helix-turn-helix domain-containing protein [Clostridiaceae]|uniref:Helix-turn-helix transcriptional regulator n=1 Tax=Clostridium facile TaxID=2763035 RepID=A0ABR7INR3_9CLOT|nr:MULTISPECIES: helix-turn-helix transcriptional regulator [Clostridiaceae]MBC5786774.1 helix-turn-helix transcriptional regulator [Clostridium facile]
MKIDGNKLMDAMRSKGMTVADLERDSGVSRKTIQLAMDNITQHTSKDTIKKIARALNISPIRLEGGKQC